MIYLSSSEEILKMSWKFPFVNDAFEDHNLIVGIYIFVNLKISTLPDICSLLCEKPAPCGEIH